MHKKAKKLKTHFAYLLSIIPIFDCYDELNCFKRFYTTTTVLYSNKFNSIMHLAQCTENCQQKQSLQVSHENLKKHIKMAFNSANMEAQDMVMWDFSESLEQNFE